MRFEELIRKNEALYKRYDRLVDKIKELQDQENPDILLLLPVQLDGKRTYVSQTISCKEIVDYAEIVEELRKEVIRVRKEIEETSEEIVRREKNSKK